MMFLPFKRATLLIPSGPKHDVERKHLFVLLTDPIQNGETQVQEVLMVSFSTIKAQIPFDDTCILVAGEHPFIKHNSFVFYRYAMIQDCNKLIKGVQQGLFEAKERINIEIFNRICHGIEVSKHTPQKCLKFYQKSLK